jgi:hypothetical protein
MAYPLRSAFACPVFTPKGRVGAAVAVAMLGLWLVSGPATAQYKLQQREPMRVTTDTPEYCQELSGEVQHAEDARMDTPPEAQFLAEEGRRMCERGLLRGGIARLRRALIILNTGYGRHYRH